MKRKICVITGGRAEYGLLRPLLEELRGDTCLCLQLIVTGMHLSSEFGFTYREIENDGFIINKKVDMRLKVDTSAGILKSMGFALSGFAKAYKELTPDIIVVLGDRYEIFSAVVAAYVSRIPVAHIHGGESTEGVFDEGFRHSITKMSYLHFSSTEKYRTRIIQLGESPERVFNVGAIGLDNIKKLKLLPKSELERALKFEFKKHNLLVTFHPVTLEHNTSKEQFKNLLEVLDGLKKTALIFTKANADTGGRIINSMIDKYVLKNRNKASAFTSMGQIRYLSTMKFVDAVVGNSSSGIIEAPSFKIGTINIGDRQKGRLKLKSVIDCQPEKMAIKTAIKKLYSLQFQGILKNVTNQYGDGKAAERIKDILKHANLTNTFKKSFYDVKIFFKE